MNERTLEIVNRSKPHVPAELADRQVENILATPCNGLFPTPALTLGERVRVGSGANAPLVYRTIPGTVQREASSGEAGGFPQ